MNNHVYIQKMLEIQQKIIEYIESEDVYIDYLAELVNLFNNHKIIEEKPEIKSILYIILNISNNHHREIDFFDKIFKIILYLKKYLEKNFTNNEIFNIFKTNKRILLFLFNKEIIKVNQFILTSIFQFEKARYPQYFFKEIKLLIDQTKVEEISKEIENEYEELRNKGENESYICQLIRKDLIDEFVVYTNKTLFPIKSYHIQLSIYETNLFLLDKSPTLLEYSAFYSSIQIFKYLCLNGVILTPSIWIYAIHGSNPDLIHFREENKINPENDTFKNCLNESILCHHNDIANYMIEKVIDNDENLNLVFN